MIFLAIYIISPIDAYPLFLDDLIAAVILFYALYKNDKRKAAQQTSSYYSESRQANNSSEAGGPLTLDKAYRLLGVSPDTSLDDLSRVYKEKMTKSHPDKVSHLSEELQEKARELTLDLNQAYELIKRSKNG